jgi:hypothetical protein
MAVLFSSTNYSISVQEDLCYGTNKCNLVHIHGPGGCMRVLVPQAIAITLAMVFVLSTLGLPGTACCCVHI